MEYGTTSWIDKTRGWILKDGHFWYDTSKWSFKLCSYNKIALELLQLFNNSRETFLTSLRGRGLYFKDLGSALRLASVITVSISSLSC